MTQHSPEELAEREWEEKRIAEANQRVRLSIALHGGPWGGCDECHELEEEQRTALLAPEQQWLQVAEKWERHFALD